MMQSSLWILGTPLSENLSVGESSLERLEKCSLIVAESRKVANRWCSKRKALDAKNWFFLDGMKPADERQLQQDLKRCKASGEDVALFSDGGMPILFDPGENVLQWARDLDFRIRTLAGPTSWATACAISGLNPPFLIEGFLPRKTEDRKHRLETLKKRSEAIVLMDTPYRFESLLEQVAEQFPATLPIFVAWEIGEASEKFIWSSVGKIQTLCKKESMQKGEFILVLGGASKFHSSRER